MKLKPVQCVDFVGLYSIGFYPFFDREEKSFYWTREENRSVILLSNPELPARVQKMTRGVDHKFEIRWNSSKREVIQALSDENIKQNTWVTGGVKDVYCELAETDFLWTIEAWNSGALSGALLGINLQGVFLAETMFALEENASKICLCELVLSLRSMNYQLIDVQKKHHRSHPAARLGEIEMPFRDYCTRLREGVFTL